MEQRLEIKQIQTVSQKILLGNMILQYSGKELEEYIQKEAEENPTIEIVENTDFIHYSSSEDMDDVDSDYYIKDNAVSLKEHLLMQITQDFSRKEKNVLEYLIDSIDSNGFLKVEADKVAQLFSVNMKVVYEMITLIQSLEPYGIGARDLKECWIIQCRKNQLDDENLIRFIKEGLDLYAQGKFGKIKELLKIDTEQIQNYLEIIRSLNPRPGAMFSSNEDNVYIVPDVYIASEEDDFSVKFNNHIYHQIRLAEHYKAMYQNASKEEKEFLRLKAAKMQLIQRSIEQREVMIVSLTKMIIQRQKRFFLYGEGNLCNLTMQEAADALRVNVSSISRGVNGKYLQCEWGIYPLKYFFAHGIDKSGMVSTDIKSLIKEFVDKEDKINPLSDQEICSLLNEKGIPISRRTVAKYRAEKGIPTKNQRMILK